MALKVGRPKNKARQPRSSRVPLNYYRSGPAKAAASPFARKSRKKGRLRKYFVRTLNSLILVLLFVGLLYSLLVKPMAKIQVNDTSYHSAAEYQAAAAKQLGSLRNRNKITINQQAVTDSLEKQFPEIASASLELPLFSETAIIHLNIAKPSFFLSSGGQNYIIDSQGVATSIAKNLPQIKNLVTLSDQSGYQTQPGQQVLSAQSVNFINNLLTQAAFANVPVKSLELPPQAEELDLRTSDRAYYVKFYLGGNALLQTGQFLASRHNFDLTGRQPAEYLDVRVPGKVFFK